MATNGIDQTSQPKLTLYTNHGCPFAQRAHITLDELKLPYDEVIIDLENPRPQWYLDINPRGLVPTLKYALPHAGFPETTVTESAIVANFLAEVHNSHLLPTAKSDDSATAKAEAAQKRARISFFADTWMSKISPAQFAILRAKTPEEKASKLQETMTLVSREIEPLLATAKPFFDGSSELTMAEVLTAPFVIRWMALGEDGEMMPKTLQEDIEKLPNFSAWVKAVLAHENATRMFEKEPFLKFTKKRLEKM